MVSRGQGTTNVLLLLPEWPCSLQVTVAVEVPASVPGSTVHVHETLPTESAALGHHRALQMGTRKR
jgi:hypothetical protein